MRDIHEEKYKAALVAAKWLDLPDCTLIVTNRDYADVGIIHRDIRHFIKLFTDRDYEKKFIDFANARATELSTSNGPSNVAGEDDAPL